MMPTARQPIPEETKKQTVVGNILRGSLGNMVEWFDFYSFTVFGTYFAHHFFASGKEDENLLGVLGIFAAGFVMRPVGSWFFGRYADQRGRRAALTMSVLLMAGGSLLIAVTPGIGTMGIGATVVLLVARLVQGFSVGGEYGTSATYMSEMATRNARGFYSSFQYLTLVSGQVLALVVQIFLQATLSDAALHAWGWRIPFALGALAAVTCCGCAAGWWNRCRRSRWRRREPQSAVRLLPERSGCCGNTGSRSSS